MAPTDLYASASDDEPAANPIHSNGASETQWNKKDRLLAEIRSSAQMSCRN